MWLSKFKELKLCLRAGRVTLPYPFVRSAPAAGFRGRPVLDGDKCLGCGACAQVCPPRTIFVMTNKYAHHFNDYAPHTYSRA
jgi:hydrogenase-4 component H